MNLFRRILVLAAAVLPMLAAAQAWPTKPIKLILPFPPGGQTDAVVRYYAQKAEATLGQSIVVENKPGVNSVIGTQEVARAPSDGYTLLFNMTAIVSNPVLLPDVAKYDALRDFTPIYRAYELYAVLAVPASAPYKTLADFVAAAKASPQPFTYGTTGHASSSHYFVEMLAKQAKLTLVHVPYKGEAPLLPDLISGRVQAGIVSGAAIKQFAGANGLRPLAVSGNKRLALLPDVPTFKELGYEGIGNESFAGFFAPAATPKAIVDKLNQEFARISALPETRERLAPLVLEPATPGTPEQFLGVMKSAQAEWVNNSKIVDLKPL
jgi:tripartite-type tricarboxylate transporter receptor subunit TctC